jgi:23S rRNA (cytidine1920-2'-O)/16S rRNA (cytidine1409-2'-O)-methyltransferase
VSRTRAPTKTRLDVALVERGLADSRAKAQALILAGVVIPARRRLDKPGLAIGGDLPLELRGQDHPGSPAAASSSPTPSITSASIRRAASGSTSAPRPAASPMCASRAALQGHAVDVGT